MFEGGGIGASTFVEEAARAVDRRTPADEAMDRYGDGDDDAFGTLYDEVGPRLYKFAVRQTRNPESAEDIVQQTMMQLHCHRQSFRRGGRVIPWAFAIARRLHIDALRKRRYEEQLTATGEPSEGAQPQAPLDFNPDAMLVGKELEAAATAALQEMAEGQREAFLLVRVDGLSMAEAADVLGISVSAVKVRAHRAYEAVRHALARQESP